MKKALVIGLAEVFLFSIFVFAADAYLDVGPTPSNDPPEECPDLLNPEGDYSDPSVDTDASDDSASVEAEVECGEPCPEGFWAGLEFRGSHSGIMLKRAIANLLRRTRQTSWLWLWP